MPVCQSHAYACLSIPGVCMFVNLRANQVLYLFYCALFVNTRRMPVCQSKAYACLSIPRVCLFVNPRCIPLCQSRAKPCLEIPGTIQFCIYRVAPCCHFQGLSCLPFPGTLSCLSIQGYGAMLPIKQLLQYAAGKTFEVSGARRSGGRPTRTTAAAQCQSGQTRCCLVRHRGTVHRRFAVNCHSHSAVAATSAVAAPSPDWQQNVEQRLAASERVLGDMHGMLQSFQRDAANATSLQAQAESRPSSSATETVVAGSSHTVAAHAAPWLTANALTGSDAVDERASNCASSSMRTRTKIWSCDFIDLATLLIERKHDEQNWSQLGMGHRRRNKCLRNQN